MRTDPEALDRAARRFAEVVAAVEDAAWERPTGCDVSVRELAEHVLAGNEFAVRLLAGAGADEARAGIDEIRLDDDVAGHVNRSCAAQAAAFRAADPGRMLHHPSGDLDLATFFRLRLAELVIHGWDIAVAAGVDATMDPAAARALWDLAEAADELGPSGAYRSPDAPPPPGTDVQHRLLHAYGRGPLTGTGG